MPLGDWDQRRPAPATKGWGGEGGMGGRQPQKEISVFNFTPYGVSTWGSGAQGDGWGPPPAGPALCKGKELAFNFPLNPCHLQALEGWQDIWPCRW